MSRRAAPAISALTAVACCLLWVSLGHGHFEHGTDSGGVSLAWAFVVVLGVYLVGCVVIGYAAKPRQLRWGAGAGVLVAVFLEFSYDGAGQPLANYWLGVLGNAVVFLAPGAVALFIGSMLGRRRQLPDPPA